MKTRRFRFLRNITPKLLVFGGLIISSLVLIRIFDGGASAKIDSTSTYFGRTVYNHSIKDELKPANSTLIDRSKMNKVLTGSIIDGLSAAQSLTITDKYFIVVQNDNSNKKKNHMLVYEKTGNHKLVKDLTFNLGHGNGVAYDSKRGEILVVDEKKVHRINASTFEYIGSKTVTNSDGSKEYTVTGIAYDAKNDRYYMSSGKKIYTVTPDTFKLYNHMSSDHVQVNQDTGYYNGYIYRVVWAKDTNDKRGYFGANDSILLQFAADGSSFKSYYTNKPTCEMESIAFDGGRPYFLYNNCDGEKWTWNSFTVMSVSDAAVLKNMYHQYKLTYNANGGSWPKSGAPEPTNRYVGVSSAVTNVKPTRTGYSFLGWAKSKKATSATYVAGDKTVLKKFGDDGKDLILYAVWKEKPKKTTKAQSKGTDTVSGTSAGSPSTSNSPTTSSSPSSSSSSSSASSSPSSSSSSSSASSSTSSSTAKTPSTSSPTSSSSSSSSSTPATKPINNTGNDTKKQVTTDVDVVPKNTDSTPVRVVSLNANGGLIKDDGEAPVAPVVVDQMSDPIAAPNADDYERDGYVLDGWSTVENPTENDVIYEPGEEIVLPASEDSTDVVLYAQWSVDETPDTPEPSEQVQEEKEVLPKTGPVETAWLLLGLFAVVSGAFLWVRSCTELYDVSKKV